MKYIVYEVVSPPVHVGQKIPFIFPSNLVHLLAHHGFLAVLTAHNLKAMPIAAGDIAIFGSTLTCGGESKTLGLISRGAADAMLIHNYDYSHGIENEHTDEMLRTLKERMKDEGKT